MIVVVILGVFVMLVVVSVGGQMDKVNIIVVKSNMFILFKVFDFYKLDNFWYLMMDEGFEVLVEKFDSVCNWFDGGYIKKVFLDFW